MKEFNKLYNELTGVDIDEQNKKFDERSKGYYGEYLTLKELLYRLEGSFKVLMNLNIPIQNKNKTTEIDLIIIHEVGIFVFEIKHYKGVIYGDSEAQIWTQSFKTVKNNVFKSPIKQNEYHIKSLKTHVPEDLPWYSIIVFTNEDCVLKVTNQRNEILITNLNNLYNLTSNIKKNEKVLSIDGINNIFNQLKVYSNITEDEEGTDSYEMLTLNNLIQGIKHEHRISLNKFKTEKEQSDKILEILKENHKNLIDGFKMDIKKKEKQVKDKKGLVIVLATILALMTGGLILLFFLIILISANPSIKENTTKSNQYNITMEDAIKDKNEAIQKLEDMKKNFTQVETIKGTDFEFKENSFEVKNLVIKPHNSFKNAYYLTFDITNNTEYYLYIISKTELVVILNNGKSISYKNIYKHMNNNLGYLSPNKTVRTLPFDLINIDNEIEYIKLINLEIKERQTYGIVSKIKNFELEIYNKEQ